MKKVNSSNSVDLLPRVLRTVWSSIQHFRRKWKKKERSGRSMTTQRQGGVTSACVCQRHLREVGQIVWDERRNQKGCCWMWPLSSKKKQQMSHWWTLKLALEPLFFFFALEFLQNDRLNISSFCGIYFGITTTTLRTLDSGTNIFCKGTLLSELETIIGTSSTVSGLSFATLAAILDPFTQRLSGWWQKNFLTSAGHNQRDGIFLPITRTREWERRRQCNGCFDEEYRWKIETSCKLVRDVIESQ